MIVFPTLKHSSSGYSLGPETVGVTVSKISSKETFLKNHSFFAIFFHSELGWREMNRIKETRKKLEFIVLRADIIILVCIYSFKIFDPMQNYS